MSNVVISVENLSKAYRLGQIGTGTLSRDINVWWAKRRGKPNPLLKIGQEDHGNRDGEILWALKDINFQVERGEVLGIIGRNGAGKSTLLKVLSRVTAPTDGKVGVKGRIASLLEVGTGFHPDLTGRENTYLNGAIFGMNRREIARKFDEIVDFSGVEPFIDTPVKRYSSGMYVRLAFAVAAHLEPEILVVDEVLAVGDAEFQKKCLGKMGDAAQKGRTVLFVSHNMAAIRTLCIKCILLEQGTLSFLGDVGDTINKYLSYMKSDENIPLLESKLREGNGVLRVVDWFIVDEQFGKGRTIGSDHACEFHICYASNFDVPDASRVSVAITINNQLGDPLLCGSTEFLKKEFRNIPKTGRLRCRFEHLPLLPGDYKLRIWCSVNGEAADLIPNAGTFQVVETDIFGTGKVPGRKHGWFVVRHEWDISR